MATTIQGSPISLPVALASVIRQRRLVKVDSNGNAVESDAAGENVVGVALEASTAAQEAAIPVATLNGDVVSVEAGAAVVPGTLVGADAQGRVVTVTGATDRAIGVAITAAGAAGEFISVATGVTGFAAQA